MPVKIKKDRKVQYCVVSPSGLILIPKTGEIKTALKGLLRGK